jgi:hypothetical protein
VVRKMGSLALVATSLAALMLAPPAAATDFSAQSIRGTFTLFVEGRAAPGNLFDLVEGTPLFAIATVTFDGFGNCQSKDRIVARGRDLPEGPPLILREASACTYSVQRDGFGTFAVTFDEPVPTVTTTTFIITNRNEIQFIANNPDLGIYGGGVLKRQSI